MSAHFRAVTVVREVRAFVRLARSLGPRLADRRRETERERARARVAAAPEPRAVPLFRSAALDAAKSIRAPIVRA